MMVALGVLLISMLIVATTGIAATTYTISVSPNVDTPTKTVSYNGDPYTISDLGRVDPGESVTLDVTAPSNEYYEIIVYNSKQRIMNQPPGATGNHEFTIETTLPGGDSYQPGTYVAIASHSGESQAVQPIVVSGYAVELTAPDTAEQDTQITVDADVTTINDEVPITQAQAVITDGSNDRRVTLTDNSGNGYSETFTLDTLDPGEYSLYVVVQGDDEFLGNQELLGVSNTQSFTIGSNHPGSSATPSPTPTLTTPLTSPGTGPGTGTGSPDDPTDTPPNQQPTTETSTPQPTSTPTSPDSVITPNTSPATTTPGQPLGVIPVLTGIILFVFLAHRNK